MKKSMPYADTRLAKFVETRVLELRSRKSQIEIATEAGYVNPNNLAMIKNGSTKLPLDRVAGVAKALECDPRLLFKLALVPAAAAHRSCHRITGPRYSCQCGFLTSSDRPPLRALRHPRPACFRHAR